MACQSDPSHPRILTDAAKGEITCRSMPLQWPGIHPHRVTENRALTRMPHIRVEPEGKISGHPVLCYPSLIPITGIKPAIECITASPFRLTRTGAQFAPPNPCRGRRTPLPPSVRRSWAKTYRISLGIILPDRFHPSTSNAYLRFENNFDGIDTHRGQSVRRRVPGSG